MTTYEDSLTLGEARERYFEASGIGREYDVRWVKLEAGPIPIWFPNTKGRVRAAKLHDLHHVATEYETTWTGEGEIGAWELASGCRHFFWAWILNLNGFLVGLFLAPVRVFRAFVRGRESRNLYHLEREFREALLDETVGSLRDRLRLREPVGRAQPADVAFFASWVALALANALWIPAVVVLLVV